MKIKYELQVEQKDDNGKMQWVNAYQLDDDGWIDMSYTSLSQLVNDLTGAIHDESLDGMKNFRIVKIEEINTVV